MAANSAQIANLLMPGLYKVSGQYDRYQKEWPQVFSTIKSTLQTETAVQTRILGPAQMKVEGGATAFDNNMGQRSRWNATAFEASLGYAITLRAVEDNQYTSDFNLMNLRLVDSFSQFKEVQGANIINNSTTYDATVGGDGKALLATDHPYDLGTWANTFTIQLDLNESSLLQAFTNIGSTFVDEAGMRIDAKAEKVLVPPALEAAALRLMRAELRPGTANNDPNVIPMMSAGTNKFMVYHYLTSNYSWFVKTNKPGLHYFDRIAYDNSMWVDDVTDNIMVKGRERYTFNYRDPRALWGSTPTS